MPVTANDIVSLPTMDNKTEITSTVEELSVTNVKTEDAVDENSNKETKDAEKEKPTEQSVSEGIQENGNEGLKNADDGNLEKGAEMSVIGDNEQLLQTNAHSGKLQENDKTVLGNSSIEQGDSDSSAPTTEVEEKTKDMDDGWEEIDQVENKKDEECPPVSEKAAEIDEVDLDKVGTAEDKEEVPVHEQPSKEPEGPPTKAEDVYVKDSSVVVESVQENTDSAPVHVSSEADAPQEEPQADGEKELPDTEVEQLLNTEEKTDIPVTVEEADAITGKVTATVESQEETKKTTSEEKMEEIASCKENSDDTIKESCEKESVTEPSIDPSIVAESSAESAATEAAVSPAGGSPDIPSATSPSAEPPAIVISPAVESPQPPPRPEKMSLPPSPTIRAQPIPPPRRPSSAVLTGTLKRTPASTRGSGKLFSTLPSRSTLSSTQEEVGRKKKKGMFSWLGGDSSKKKNKEVLETVSDGLRKIYKQKLYPLEEFYKFHDFHSPALDDPDFDAKPMILLVGQYSTGKTTFIRYLLEQDFPGIRIGPEPTTDRFIAVMYGDEEGVIPGNALVVDAKKQFRALSGFGNAFLNRFQCSSLPNQVLESVTIVDTPGILSGEKQRIDRGYDFTGVLEWFAERVDRIILLFDAHKLDISDEFKRCIEALAGNEDKIRIVLNKSDMVDHQQLMRVYGALMWSLGKVFKTPEVSRVYLGSFWDHPLHYDINRRLFQDEQHDLFQDLQALPRNAALRKLNDLIKRARLAKVHAYIISELRKQMPSMIGKEKKKKELIQNLDKIFEQIQREHNISPGDFPDIHKMREKLQNQDFTKFNPLKPKLLEVVDGMLASDIARLMAQIPKEEQTTTTGAHELPTVKGGAFSQAQEAETPFGFGRGEGFDKGADEVGWVVNRERSSADSTFESLGPVNGFISGRAAKEHMVKSKLPNAVLGKIWKLADVDQDGQLDTDEFALANYLINLKLEGHELPAELPAHLVPPTKREKEAVYPALDEE